MQFTDAVTIEGTKLRSDGYLVVDARIARTGIQQYLGSEMGRPDLAVVNVYRPEAEVFDQASMASFAYRPITDDHPTVAVTSKNSKELARGWSDGEVARDGHRLRVPMMLTDQGLIDKVMADKRELSAGYTCDLKWEPGTTPEGLTYDAIQTNIRANHIAVVQRGRAGKECRIGDSADLWGSAPNTAAHDKETTMTLRTVLVDGLSVETTDAGAQAISKLQNDLATIRGQLNDSASAHTALLAAKDKDISTLQAKLDDAQAKVLDAASLSKLVSDRVALEATAVKIAKDVSPVGLTDAALKAAVVKAKRGDKITADKLADEAYVSATFDILAEDLAITNDTFRQARLGDGRPAFPGQAPVQLNDAQKLRQQAFDDLLHFDQTGVERQSAN